MITLGRYTFESNGTERLIQSAENWSDISNNVAISTYNGESAKEIATSFYGNSTAKNLEEFVTKTLSSGGYYIGRYEAGDAYATDSERTDSTNDTNPIVSKAGVYPYNYITQPQASSLCQNMYKRNNFQSDLINSYAWDTAIVFIQKFSGDKNYSMQAGRTTARVVQKCAENFLDHNLDKGDLAQDIRCNIYDMAGNTTEWSTETNSNSEHPCINQGSFYNDAYSYTSSRYGQSTTLSIESRSTRPILYL